jgi:sulfur carrier protein ThiS
VKFPRLFHPFFSTFQFYFSMKVQITKVPGRTETVFISDDTTIDQAITQAGFPTSGVTVRINGVATTDFSANVNDGDVILVAEQTKAN